MALDGEKLELICSSIIVEFRAFRFHLTAAVATLLATFKLVERGGGDGGKGEFAKRKFGGGGKDASSISRGVG